ncbi:MAG: hypothetical protein RMZ69_30130 [Nostoc sp. ChiQUE01a]|nr:hypothetical protein [Nostoc sp. ChiQUE01a]
MRILLANSFIPQPLKNTFTSIAWSFNFINAQVRLYKEAWLSPNFNEVVLEIAQLPLGQIPTRKMLAALLVGWGNNFYAADLDYVEEVAKQAANTPGPILECGSGVTTILLALLAGRRGVEVWSLEHIPEWYTHVHTVLQNNYISGVNLHLSSLDDFGSFYWYKPPLTSLPNDFRLIICDGPPGNQTPGGRYGLLPVLKQHFSANVLILLDDAERESEAEVLRQWTTEARANVVLKKYGYGSFAFVTFPNSLYESDIG